MSTFKYKNSLRTIGAEISEKVKNNEARPEFTGSYKKKACIDVSEWITGSVADYFSNL